MICHYKFYEIFDLFADIVGVKKIPFKNKTAVSFSCLKKHEEFAISIFEEIYTFISPKVLNNFTFGLRKKSILNSDYMVFCFHLAKNIDLQNDPNFML